MAFDAGAAVGKIDLDTSSWDAGVNKVSKSQKVISGVAKGIAKTVAAIGTAAIAAFGAAVKSADDWQKSFANVTTLVDTTEVNVQEMAKGILSLNGALGSSKDLTNGLYQALSASVEPTKAVEFVATSAEFAKAALVDTNTAVDVITTGLNAYGYEADKATDISDKLFSVIKLGKTTGDELSATIGQSIPLAANMGVSFDELGASIAVMTRQGINSANATTQFNAVINAFLKPSDDMAAAIKEIGFESGEAAIEQLGFKGALDAVTETSGGSKEALAGLFNNTRALRGVLALTGEGAKDFDNILNDITNSSGATREAFEKQEITFDTLKNQMGTLSILVGNVGKEFVDKLAVGASAAADSMIDFLISGRAAEPIGNIVGFISGGFEVLKTALTPIVKAIFPELKKISGTVSEALVDITGKADASSGVFSFLSGTVNIGVSVFKILSTALQSTITNIGNLIKAIRESGATIGNFFQFLAGKKSWDEVKAQATSAAEAFDEFGEGFSNGFENIFDTIGNEINSFTDEQKKLAKNLDLSYKVAFAETKNNAISAFDSIITGQDDFVASILSGTDEIRTGFDDMNKAASDGAFKTTSDVIEYYNKIAAVDGKVVSQQIDNQEKLQEEYKKTAETITGTFGPVLSELGSTLVDSEKGWEDFKKAGLSAIASLVEGFAKQWALQSAAYFAALDFVRGSLFAAASIAAYIGAGAIRQLKTGGYASGLTLVGESGPELVDFMGSPSRVFSNSETNNMIGGNTFYVTFTGPVNSEIDIEKAMIQAGKRLNNNRRKI